MQIDEKKKPQIERKERQIEPNPQMTSGVAPNEEQMMRRQSAPRPTIESEAARLQQQQMQNGGVQNETQLHGGGNGTINGFKALAQVIGREQVQKANQTLQKYKEGKANLEKRIIENEQWYKLRHWECMRKNDQEIQPTSAWLLNCILNKHADALDNFPEANILPREAGDKAEAEKLTAIVPVVLSQCEFEQVYSDVWYYKLKAGTGVYGVFWDKEKHNSLGDISIKKIDLLSLFWESGIQDIQKSKNLFHVELYDNDQLISTYPQLQGKLGSSTIDVAKYVYDDAVDTSNKSVVVDWYYKKRNAEGKVVLHYCKYVNDEVLFATENEDPFAERGWYDHAMYPFVFDGLYPIEGTPCSFGLVDIGKDAQAYIDRGNQAIMKNMLANASPRYFVRSDGSVNEKEFSDLSKEFIHVDGNLGQDSIMPVQFNTLNGVYVDVVNNKIEELKETMGNRDVSTGGTTGGVTAASALSAMMEASGKLSRDSNKSAYRAFEKVVSLVVELIRQFYDMPRSFRIIGEDGMMRFMEYSNAGIVPQNQGVEMGIDMGFRLPVFDFEISAQKKSAYSRMSQNELALQFYQLGFFSPENSTPSLACLEMMDFDRKNFIVKMISQNGTIYQQMQQMQQQMMMLAQMVDQSRGTNEVAPAIAAQLGMQAPPAPVGAGGSIDAEKNELLGGKQGGEPKNVKEAKQRVAESTSPA